MSAPNYETRAPGIVACAVVMIIISSLAVIFRFWSRAVAASLRFWWDDWLILATLVTSPLLCTSPTAPRPPCLIKPLLTLPRQICSHVFLSVTIYWTTIGLGVHTRMIPMRNIRPNTIANRVSLVFYTTTIWLIKVSALLLYARIFKVKRSFTVMLWVVGAIVTAWWVVAEIVPWTFCHPIAKAVNPLMKGRCGDASAWYTALAFINAFFDLVILLLPMPVIWNMHMTLHKRIIITLVFLLGYW